MKEWGLSLSSSKVFQTKDQIETHCCLGSWTGDLKDHTKSVRPVGEVIPSVLRCIIFQHIFHYNGGALNNEQFLAFFKVPFATTQVNMFCLFRQIYKNSLQSIQCRNKDLELNRFSSSNVQFPYCYWHLDLRLSHFISTWEIGLSGELCHSILRDLLAIYLFYKFTFRSNSLKALEFELKNFFNWN